MRGEPRWLFVERWCLAETDWVSVQLCCVISFFSSSVGGTLLNGGMTLVCMEVARPCVCDTRCGEEDLLDLEANLGFGIEDDGAIKVGHMRTHVADNGLPVFVFEAPSVYFEHPGAAFAIRVGTPEGGENLTSILCSCLHISQTSS
ncbi:hypothetical protein BDQ12DRAFT_690844 [Crucibulum laeve]|uniref:Uncharacterized protein n=1 Tax=Crucibulum laeve TaxID=68775 RepID=A0A5C3LKI8_9AGAR|nr:hypothetical protein BDQ12DRAFT_690844 [Crucibulum laeve]